MALQANDLHCENGWWQSPDLTDLKASVEPLDRYGKCFKIVLVAGTKPIVDRLILCDLEKRKAFLKRHRDDLNGFHQPAEELIEALAGRPSRELLDALDDAHETSVLPKFEPVSLIDFIGTESEPLEWLVEGLIRPRRLSILTGPANSGKTWLAYDLGIAVSTGRRWLHEFPVTQGRTFFIQEDDDEALARSRLRSIHVEGMLRGRAGANDPPLDVVVQRGYRADIPASSDRLLEWVQQHEPKLVIVDALSNTHHREENNEAAIKPVLETYQQVATQGPAVVLVHHDRKGQGAGKDRMRGSSLLRDRADTVLRVTSTEHGCKVVVDKLKAAKKPDPFAVTFAITYGVARMQYTGEISRRPTAVDQAEALILELLASVRADAAHSTAQIVEALRGQVGERQITGTLSDLRQRGAIAFRIGARNRHEYWSTSTDGNSS